MRHSRLARPGAAALAAALLLPAAASADGLPVLGVDVGPSGVAVPGGPARLIALPVAGGRTLLQRVSRPDGRVRAWRLLGRRLTIPAVAYDATAGGLSADGRTLVLIRPRRTFPQRSTTLAVADARRLELRRVIRLRGDFSFDAVSPRGDAVFLIHYTSRRDPTRYEVRVLDPATGALRAGPVIDPAEPDEAMRGAPLSRAASPDGRWAYTLYDGAGGEPFVHALDTSATTARCIDLPLLEGHEDLGALRLRTGDGGRRLRVVDGAQPVAEVDTATWAVTAPGAEPRAVAATRRAAAGDGGDGDPWWLLAVAAAVLAGAVALRPGSARSPVRPRGR